jgi:Lon protease-like protein
MGLAPGALSCFSAGNMSAIHLPERCGVMLLPDCTLFPHGSLPLYIFEPRYRKMLEDALEGTCFFAVARCLGEEIGDPSGYVAPIGTIGMVRASRERKDGTSQLLIHGIFRVRFTEWHVGHGYPFASVEPVSSSFEPKSQALAAVKTLRAAVEDAVKNLPQEIQTGLFSLLDRADEPGLMTDLISQQFIHDPDLRQQLLEMDSISDRIPLICEFLRNAGEFGTD